MDVDPTTPTTPEPVQTAAPLPSLAGLQRRLVEGSRRSSRLHGHPGRRRMGEARLQGFVRTGQQVQPLRSDEASAFSCLGPTMRE